jgi:endonuclease YncB( thermonuclease family)
MLIRTGSTMRRHILALSLGLPAGLVLGGLPAGAQSDQPVAGAPTGDLDMAAPSAPAPPAAAPAHESGELDMDLEPTPPGPASQAASALPDSIQAGIREIPPSAIVPATVAPAAPAPGSPVTPAPAAEPASGPAPASPTEAAAPTTAPAPVVLEHPTVLDTGRLQANDQTIQIFGISGLSGESSAGLQSYIAANGDRVACEAQGAAMGDVCRLSDGTDLAEVALINGAAQTADDAPDAYRQQQTDAQAARRGIWASLPPPPVAVQHPTVRETSILEASGEVYTLAGIQGYPGPLANDLQGYVAANGDMLTCQPQGETGRDVCLMADGTDLAKVALVNGAARVTSDAPDSYRLQQREAMDHHRGIWANPNPQLLALSEPAQAEVFVLAAGDQADGISYVDGEPTAVIDGGTVFLSYAGPAGWGYYDHYHHWHGAPDRLMHHMERFHPEGRGLRGYDERRLHEAAYRGAMHPEFGGHADAAHGFMHPPAYTRAAMASRGFHPGEAPGFHPGAPGFHPGEAPGFHPGAPGFHPGEPSAFHPGAPGFHPGEPPSAFHPGAPPGFHPGAPGFHPGEPTGVRPGVPAGFHPGMPAAGVHPGGAPPAMHAAAPAPAPHPSAPAPRHK